MRGEKRERDREGVRQREIVTKIQRDYARAIKKVKKNKMQIVKNKG